MKVPLTLASIIASLLAIPFLIPDFNEGYSPTGALLFNVNTSEEIPRKTTSFSGPEMIEKEIQSPYGKFKVKINYDSIEQILYAPDKVIIVSTNYNKTEWKIQTKDIILSVSKTPSKIVERCEMASGYIEVTNELGSISETNYGTNFENMKSLCKNTEKILQEWVERMEAMKKQLFDLPPKIVINEFYVDGNITFNETNATQWVELYNHEIFDVNLSGWIIVSKKTENGNTYNCSIFGIIPAKGYLLVNCSEKLGKSEGEIILKKGEEIIDRVAYGSFDDGNKEDNAPLPDDNNSTGRCPNGNDTDNDKNDFSKMPATPLRANVC